MKKCIVGIVASFMASLSLAANLLSLDQQREIYLKAEMLLPYAVENNNFRLIDQLIAQLNGYPLLPQLQYQRLMSDTQQLTAEKIHQFTKHHPMLAERKHLTRTWYQILQKREDWQGILQFSEAIPKDLISRCIYLSAQARQHMSNEGLAGQSTMAWKAVDNIWLSGVSLPSACDDMLSLWQRAGQQTHQQVRERALLAFKQGSDGLLRHLRNQANDVVLTAWLQSLVELRANPQSLSLFVHTAAINQYNREVVDRTFRRYINQLDESQFDSHDPFAPYIEWGSRFGLSIEQLKLWRAAIVSKLFDSDNPILQQWRDQQIINLQQDDLIERRIRLAILSQQNLNKWLDLLSDNAKKQQEWRFWYAFSHYKHGKRGVAQQQWRDLAQERGFYPMLAAEQIQMKYQPHFAVLAQAEYSSLLESVRPDLAQIEELLAINEYQDAKQAWLALLRQSDKMQKIALAEYANSKNWYAFGVQATIDAKAWEYLAQRLPIAYPLWFELHLQGKWLPLSFAMAIARQESAWDIQAQSYANARGLMQLLPSTAQATANKFSLPYGGERQLFEPFDNIMLGTQHLQELADRFGENRILIAAAYNAGSSRVDRWLKRSDKRLSMAEFIATIPFYETRGYVQNVLTFDYYYRMLLGQSLIKFTESEANRLY